MSKESQQVNPYPIRLTKELRAKLEASAKDAGRSLNAEMLMRLEASFIESDGDAAPASLAETVAKQQEQINELVEKFQQLEAKRNFNQ